MDGTLPTPKIIKGGLSALFLTAALGLSAMPFSPLAPYWHDAYKGARELVSPPPVVAYTDFLKDAKLGKVEKVTVQKSRVTINIKDTGETFITSLPPQENIVSRLEGTDVRIQSKPESLFWYMFPILAPISVVMGGIAYLLHRSGYGAALSKGKSGAHRHGKGDTRITFNNVAGVDSAKEEIADVVEFLRDPAKARRLGAVIPRGILLDGPPGTGKTLLAKATANEAGVPFYSISGSDFVEMFAGIGAARVRDLFKGAREDGAAIIFIDEIDAVGKKRGTGNQDVGERDQTLNALLVEMDGMDSDSNVIIMAATNRPEMLDSALTRQGRFTRTVTVGLPDIKGRLDILGVHAKKIVMAPSVDLNIVARSTPGFSGADLAGLVNEAAIAATKAGKDAVYQDDFERARDKIRWGVVRSNIMSEEEREITAYHEAGHALVARYTPGSDPIHKVTILSRGKSGGMLMTLPERDQLLYKRSKLEGELAKAAGGRAAEALIFGADNITSAAGSDIDVATQYARKMVEELGMSSLGFRNFAQSGNAISPQTAAAVDTEIDKIIKQAGDKAEAILSEHKDELEKLAKALLQYETLSAAEMEDILAGKPLSRESVNAPAAPAP